VFSIDYFCNIYCEKKSPKIVKTAIQSNSKSEDRMNVEGKPSENVEDDMTPSRSPHSSKPSSSSKTTSPKSSSSATSHKSSSHKSSSRKSSSHKSSSDSRHRDKSKTEKDHDTKDRKRRDEQSSRHKKDPDKLDDASVHIGEKSHSNNDKERHREKKHREKQDYENGVEGQPTRSESTSESKLELIHDAPSSESVPKSVVPNHDDEEECDFKIAEMIAIISSPSTQNYYFPHGFIVIPRNKKNDQNYINKALRYDGRILQGPEDDYGLSAIPMILAQIFPPSVEHVMHESRLRTQEKLMTVTPSTSRK
jgi:hypothetical protein